MTRPALLKRTLPIILEKQFRAKLAKNAKEKQPIGLSLCLYKYMNFFATFASLREICLSCYPFLIEFRSSSMAVS